MMFKKIILGQLRHLLGSGSSGVFVWLVQNGASVDDAKVIIAGIIAVVSFAWSAFDKYNQEKKIKISSRTMNMMVLLLGVLVLSSCAALEKIGITNKPNCYESVAISKIAIDEVFNTAVTASKSEVISVKSAKEALDALDYSNVLVNNASALCAIDEPAALDYLDLVQESLSEITEILRGEKS